MYSVSLGQLCLATALGVLHHPFGIISLFGIRSPPRIPPWVLCRNYILLTPEIAAFNYTILTSFRHLPNGTNAFWRIVWIPLLSAAGILHRFHLSHDGFDLLPHSFSISTSLKLSAVLGAAIGSRKRRLHSTTA